MARYPRLDLTGSDYDSIREDVLARINIAFPEWTDTNPGNPGMVLSDLLCYIGDLIRYYQDRQCNESFLITAVERANVIRHLKALGYQLGTAVAASVDVVFSIPDVLTEGVPILARDQVTTDDGSIVFEVLEDTEIAAGSLSVTAGTKQGETIDEDVATSDGSPNQKYSLAQTPFLAASETIYVGGVAWNLVVDFLDSTSSSQDYRIEIDENDKAWLFFGDGVNGAAPVLDDEITATYRIGGGLLGNVEAGSLTRTGKSYETTGGTSVQVSVTNPSKAVDGDDRETTAHGKLYGPRAWTTLDRSVAAPDYVTNAERVAGVSRPPLPNTVRGLLVRAWLTKAGTTRPSLSRMRGP